MSSGETRQRDLWASSSESSGFDVAKLPDKIIKGTWVNGAFVANVPVTYDPDTYDYQHPVPGPPDPKPYDVETYEAWGRERFGDEWLELRRIMMKERNFHLATDDVYNDRQRKLRVLERKVERRPFKPVICRVYRWNEKKGSSHSRRYHETVDDEAWQQLWERLQRELPPEDLVSHRPVIPLLPRTPTPPAQGSRTPQSRPPSPSPPPPPKIPFRPYSGPWEALEWDRKYKYQWNPQEYNFAKIFLREELIDRARNEKDDREGNQRREAELEEIEKFRQDKDDYEWLAGNGPGAQNSRRLQLEYERRMHHFNRLAVFTPEEIDAQDRAEDEDKLELHQLQTPLADALERMISGHDETESLPSQAYPRGNNRRDTAEGPTPAHAPSMPRRAYPISGARVEAGKDARGNSVFLCPDRRYRYANGRFAKRPASQGQDSKTKKPRKVTAAVVRSPKRASRPQRIVYQKERRSRRIANLAPEHGQLEQQPKMTRQRPARTPLPIIQPPPGNVKWGGSSDWDSDYMMPEESGPPLRASVEEWITELPHDYDS